MCLQVYIYKMTTNVYYCQVKLVMFKQKQPTAVSTYFTLYKSLTYIFHPMQNLPYKGISFFYCKYT